MAHRTASSKSHVLSGNWDFTAFSGLQFQNGLVVCQGIGITRVINKDPGLQKKGMTAYMIGELPFTGKEKNVLSYTDILE